MQSNLSGGQGIEHSVDVTAETLYEAVAQAWQILGENEWNAEGGRPPTIFVVKVKQPEIEHRVRAKDFEKWLATSPKSPAEMALKKRLTQFPLCQQKASASVCRGV